MQGFWATGFLAFIPTLLFLLLFVWFYFNIFSSSPNYADQVSITVSKMVFGKHDGNPTVSVIGMLQNNSDIPLDDLQLEAQFFDKDGELLDVGSHDGYSETIPQVVKLHLRSTSMQLDQRKTMAHSRFS